MAYIFFRILLGLLVTCSAATSTGAVQEAGSKSVDVPVLISKVKASSERRTDLFVGRTAKARKTVAKGEKTESQSNICFSCFKPDQWRSEFVAMIDDKLQPKLVTIRNGDSFFRASQESSGDFTLLTNDNDTQTLIETSLTNQFPFVIVSKSVLALPLEEFLAQPQFSAWWIPNLEIHSNQTVEGIKFQFPFKKGVASGELHWLPNEGFLLRRILVDVKIRTDEGEIRIQRAADQTIEYEHFSGKLLPWKVAAAYSSGRTMTHEILNIGNVQEDPKLIALESIGLTTPRRVITK